MTQINFNVQGKPVPKGRPRHATHNGRTWEYTPKTTLEFEKKVRSAFLELGQSVHKDSCVKITIIFYMPIPKGTSKKKIAELDCTRHAKKPDLDNLVKSVLDGLNKYAYDDDSLVTDICASKVYTALEPFTHIELFYED